MGAGGVHNVIVMNVLVNVYSSSMAQWLNRSMGSWVNVLMAIQQISYFEGLAGTPIVVTCSFLINAIHFTSLAPVNLRQSRFLIAASCLPQSIYVGSMDSARAAALSSPQYCPGLFSISLSLRSSDIFISVTRLAFLHRFVFLCCLFPTQLPSRAQTKFHKLSQISSQIAPCVWHLYIQIPSTCHLVKSVLSRM